MSFLDYDTTAVPELTVLEDGEHKLRILSCEVKNSKKGDPMVALRFDDPSEPNAKDFNHFIMLPASGDDEKKKNNKLRQLKEFCDCFSIERSARGIDLNESEVVGLEGWALVGTENTPEYGDQNKVRRFIVGN